MNAFDFIVTIALGSILASVILTKNVALVDGMLAFFLLIALQYLITYLSSRYKKISDIVKSTPHLLVYKGKMLTQVMKDERIAEDEIYAILRKKGIASLEEADAIILETDGSMTVVKHLPFLNNETFRHVEKPKGLKSSGK